MHSMKNHDNHSNELTSLAEDARELLASTVDVTGERVAEARKRLTAGLAKIKTGIKATDKAVHQHPYKAIAIAAGAGILIGCFLLNRSSNKDEE
jgi:ElaB/YqjD/DUF883 family membrane-anchored ribosome-binding protein